MALAGARRMAVLTPTPLSSSRFLLTKSLHYGDTLSDRICASERDSRTELNLTARGHRHRDRAELRLVYIAVGCAKVDLVQGVEGFAAELEIGFLR